MPTTNPTRGAAPRLHLARLLTAASLGLGSLFAAPVALAEGPALIVAAPAQVEVGAVIALTLRVTQAADIAGYETALLFDPLIAEYAGAEQRDNDLQQLGRDVSPLTAVDLTGGASVGLFSCPVADCVAGGSPTQVAGGQGDLRLATVYLIANRPGQLEIRLDAVKFVDAAGQPVAVALPQASVTVQVGAAAAGPAYAAPGSMWNLLPAVQADGARAAGPFDLTGDGQVTHADVMEVALEWALLRQDQIACGPLPDPTRDINHDGCVDVADLQLVAAHYGPAEVPALPYHTYLPLIVGGGDTGGLTPTATAQTWVVNSTSDQGDSSIGNGVCRTAAGVCTLRAAIQEANARVGADTINFNLPGSGVQTIQLNFKLPTLADNGTTINGYSQPGAAVNTAGLADNAVLRVQIRGNGPTGFDGFVITSANNTIRGLALFNLRRAFWIYGSGAANNAIVGNFIGTDAAGAFGSATLGNLAHGLHIEQGAHDNRIGRPALADRNVISGNGRHGLGLWHEGTDNNIVMNNIVGLNPAGTNRLPNRKHGLDINFGAAFNIIGGTGLREHNVTSGNDDSGQELSHTSGTTGNQIIGNRVGTDLAGNSSPSWAGNRGRGILLEDGVTGNTVAHNVVGGNLKGGIEIYDSHTLGNVIRDNRIGLALNGSPIPNAFGMWIKGQGLRVGPGNIIAYNTNVGIKIEGEAADNNTLTRNSIFSNGGLGIDLFPRGVNQNDQYPHTGPNQALNFPVIASATPTSVSGTACAGCTVEIFIADSAPGAYGEGRTFVGAATATAGGSFTVSVAGVSGNQTVTATATDAAGNTSEFSLNFLVQDV